MAQLDTVQRRTQQQHGNAFAVAFFQRRIGVDVQFDDVRAEPSSKRGNRDAHVIAKMTVRTRQQCQNRPCVH